MLYRSLLKILKYIKASTDILPPFSVSYRTIHPLLQISSAIVEFSSAIVEISSDLVWISSELVWISSELVSIIAELLIISVFKNTPRLEPRPPYPLINAPSDKLLRFAFVKIFVKTVRVTKFKNSPLTKNDSSQQKSNVTEVSHPFISAIWVIVSFGEWSKNQMFSERFNARLKNV